MTVAGRILELGERFQIGRENHRTAHSEGFTKSGGGGTSSRLDRKGVAEEDNS